MKFSLKKLKKSDVAVNDQMTHLLFYFISLHLKTTGGVAEGCTRTEIVQLLNNSWSDMKMLLQAGKAINGISLDGNHSEVVKQYFMPLVSQKEHLVKLVDHVFTWKVNAVEEAANSSIKFLQYQQQGTSSNGLMVDEFRNSDAFFLLNVHVVKKVVVAWYWNAIILVFDLGDYKCKVNIKFESSLKTRKF